jgi:hypothetical protein
MKIRPKMLENHLASMPISQSKAAKVAGQAVEHHARAGDHLHLAEERRIAGLVLLAERRTQAEAERHPDREVERRAARKKGRLR